MRFQKTRDVLYIGAFIVAYAMFQPVLLLINITFLRIPGWWDMVFGVPFGFLGLIVVKHREAIREFMMTQVSEHTSSQVSRIYVIVATLGFLSPFAWFLIGGIQGTWNFVNLAMSTVAPFYLLKFVDFLVFSPPRLKITHLFSICYVILVVAQLPLPILLSGQLAADESPLVVELLALTVILYGLWVNSLASEKEELLLQRHPGLYLDMIYRGAYNALAGHLLLANMFIGFGLRTSVRELTPLSMIMGFAMILFALRWVKPLSSYAKFRADLKIKKEYRKLRVKEEKDNWHQDIISKSALARMVHFLTSSIMVLSAVSALTLVFLSRMDSSSLTIAVLCLAGILTTLSYLARSKGTSLRHSLGAFPHAYRKRDARELIERAKSVFVVALGLLSVAIFEVKPFGLEVTVLSVDGAQITNTAILLALLIASVILIVFLAFHYPKRDIGIKELNRTLGVLYLTVLILMSSSIYVFVYALVTPVLAAVLMGVTIIAFCLLTRRSRAS